MEYLALIDSKLAEAKALTAKPDCTDEDIAKAEALILEADGIKARAAKADAINAKAAAFATPAKPASSLKGVVAAATGVAGVRDRIADDPSRGFATAQDFFRAVIKNGMNGGRVQDERLQFLATAGSDEQMTQNDSLGGFLIPQKFSPNMLSLAFEGDPTADRTQKVTMSSPSIQIPARTDKNHTTSVSGGLTFSWKAETVDAAASLMRYEQIRLNAHTLAGASFISEELLQDSPMSVADIITRGFRDEYAATMLKAKLNGNGVGQPEGILNSPALVSVAKEASQTAATINMTNILKMRSRCYGYGNAIWLANHDTLPQLAALNGGATYFNLIFMPSAQDAVPDRLLGRPIFFTEFANALGAQGDLILADWSQYLEGLYQPMQTAESIHVRFLSNERCLRVYSRTDSRSWWKTPLTPAKSSSTLSPFVTLDART